MPAGPEILDPHRPVDYATGIGYFSPPGLKYRGMNLFELPAICESALAFSGGSTNKNAGQEPLECGTTNQSLLGRYWSLMETDIFVNPSGIDH